MGHPKGACCLPSATSHFSDFRHATKDYSLFGHDQDSKGADAESGEMEERAAFGACVSVVNHWADPATMQERGKKEAGGVLHRADRG